MVDVEWRWSELSGRGGTPQVLPSLAPALVVADAEQHHEVLQQCQENKDRARDQPDLNALQLQSVWRICAAKKVENIS